MRIAIFASGTGSNAKKIYQKSLAEAHFEVSCILSNRKNAKVLDFAEQNNIPHKHFLKREFVDSSEVIRYLRKQNVDMIVLAGFLLLIPKKLIELFPNRIINIHPALLPKYGGKGMYGNNVHEAVYKQGEKESGITIHYVNEKYDEGNIILQTKVKLSSSDDAKVIGEKVLKLEHHFYPNVISGLCK